MADLSENTGTSFDDETACQDERTGTTDDLLRISASLSSLIAGIQALAREREDDSTFAHIVNLADLTSGHLDELHEGIDRLQTCG